jgi:hypothetical protein
VAGQPTAYLDPTGAALSGGGPALVAVVALGIFPVSADYSSGMIKTTIAAVPRRAYLVLARASALINDVLPVAVGSTLLTPLTDRIIRSAAGVSISFVEPAVARAVVGAGLYLTVLALADLVELLARAEETDKSDGNGHHGSKPLAAPSGGASMGLRSP